MEHKSSDAQFIFDALAGSLVVERAERYLLFEDDHFEPFETETWAMVSAMDLILAKIHQAKAYVIPTRYNVWDPMLGLRRQHKVNAGERSIFNQADQPPQEASTLNSSIVKSTSIPASPPCRCWQRSNSTSRLLSTTSARNALWRRARQRIILHGDGERVEGQRQSRTRMTTCVTSMQTAHRTAHAWLKTEPQAQGEEKMCPSKDLSIIFAHRVSFALVVRTRSSTLRSTFPTSCASSISSVTISR